MSIGDSKHVAAMRAYRRFVPGLGHDGCGLFGTLTDESLRRLMSSLLVHDGHVIDIGAADGKMLLSALTLGAKSAHGVEIAGGCLELKYSAVINALWRLNPPAIESHQVTGLRCSIDICESNQHTIEAFLAVAFPHSAQFAAAGATPDLIVISHWHGFTISAKQELMKHVARSTRVVQFCVIGPLRQPYGSADEIVSYLRDYGWARAQRAPGDDLIVALSGSGEKYHAIIIEHGDDEDGAEDADGALSG